MARGLVGCTLLVDGDTADAVCARIVEVEAYEGLRDPASHAHRGPTPRAAIMFGAAGFLYVYFSYGVHHCANIVSDVDGTAGAVLLRAASVEQGADVVARRRGVRDHDALLRGPGNLCRGLGISLADNGMDLCAPGARLTVRSRDAEPPIAVSRRVGISAAADRELRFTWRDHPAVSGRRPRPRVSASAM